jgi:two-component system response regulator YesN
MYTIMVVDDEALSRYALSTLIKQHDAINIICECESGTSAVECASLYRPDIIAMDIKMPGLNGLEASEIILRNHPDIAIIIMTAYDSFEYVRQAIDLGVKGYLLKPLQAHDIQLKLDSIITEIENKRRQDDLNHSGKMLSFVRPMIERELILAFSSGHINQSQVQKYCDVLNMNIQGGYFMLLKLMEPLETACVSSPLSDAKLMIRDILKNTISFFKNGLIGELMLEVCPIFIPVNDSLNDRLSLRETKIIGEDILEKLNNKGIAASFAVGNIYHELHKLQKSYAEAVAVLQNVPPNSLMFFSNRMDLSTAPYPYALHSRFLQALKSNDFNKSKNLLDELQYYLFVSDIPLNKLKDYVLQCLISMKSELYQLGIDIRSLNTERLSEMCQLPDKQALRYQFMYHAYKTISAYEKTRTDKKNLTVLRIHKYLDETEISHMSLEGLSDYLNLSSQYVSKIFKEEFGVNFVGYLIDKRIDMAKRLLQNINISVREASLKVGYEDANYFSRIFKKHSGLTPKEYQKCAKGF